MFSDFHTRSSHSLQHDAKQTPPFFQAKLSINQPDDEYEKEADAVADSVMRMPSDGSSFFTPKAAPALQCISLPDAKETVPAEGGNHHGSDAKTEQYIGTLSNGGKPLSREEKAFFEPRFGYDFSNVRLHTDSKANQSAGDIQAKAYAHREHIVFGSHQYQPDTEEGRKLMAHELTHVVQQKGDNPNFKKVRRSLIQRDFALAVPHPDAAEPTLTAEQTAAAVTFNTRQFTNTDEISLIRDVAGIPAEPAVVDDDFVNAIARFQSMSGLFVDGKAGSSTISRLTREMKAEASALRAQGDGLGSLEQIFTLHNQLQTLVNAGNNTYATYRTRIRAATLLQKEVVLQDLAFLRRMLAVLAFDDFARCMELLGRQVPSFATLRSNATVRQTLQTAWTDSHPAQPAPGTTQHEEGGWILLNLITNVITTQRQAAGAGAAINLAAAPIVAESIVVGKFHTHPNLGPGWVAQASPQDATVDANHGVPDLVVGTTGINPAVFTVFLGGPDHRLHLAGGQGFPGAGGGLAPQAKADNTYDEI